MTDENKRANAASELAHSDESLRAAVVLLREGLLRDAESPLYYAAYHAVVALLLTNLGGHPKPAINGQLKTGHSR